MSRFDNETITRTSSYSAIDEGLRSFMMRVYAYMGLGLGLTGCVAFILSQNEELMRSIVTSPLAYLFMLAPLAMVMFLNFRINKMQASTVKMLFWAYAGVMGVSMSMILISYTTASAANIFLVTASLFGSMSFYGYTTNKDLTSMGSFLIMGVWGLILASVINIFMGNGMVDLMISALAVVIFTGLTAYDTQNIKQIYWEADSSEIATKKAVLGALRLYLDFVNIFISLMRLFGERR